MTMAMANLMTMLVMVMVAMLAVFGGGAAPIWEVRNKTVINQEIDTIEQCSGSCTISHEITSNQVHPRGLIVQFLDVILGLDRCSSFIRVLFMGVPNME